MHRRGPVLRDGDLRALDKPVQGLQNYRSSHAAPPEAPKRASGWPVPAAPRRACGGGHSTGARRLQTTVHPRSRGGPRNVGATRPATGRAAVTTTTPIGVKREWSSLRPRSSGSGDAGLWGQPAVHPPAVAGFTAWAASGAASTALFVEDCLRQRSESMLLASPEYVERYRARLQRSIKGVVADRATRLRAASRAAPSLHSRLPCGAGVQRGGLPRHGRPLPFITLTFPSGEAVASPSPPSTCRPSLRI